MADECATPVGSEAQSHTPEIVIITGMSGAGRSQAMHTFEDVGYFCIDNLPPSFIPQLVVLASLPDSRITRLAVVCDVRAQEFFDELAGELDDLSNRDIAFNILFLEADDDVLVTRFKETRRPHPLRGEGDSIVKAIKDERQALAIIRGHADLVIDTSDMTPRELGSAIRERFFRENRAAALTVTVSSFGFKYGVPIDADIVMDVRFLPNPFYNPDLRPFTGLDQPVRDFVLSRDETAAFLSTWKPLLESVLPGYVMEGKTHLVVALGCTGGMHRSVALAEETAEFMRGLGFRAAVSHRDIGKDRERS